MEIKINTNDWTKKNSCFGYTPEILPREKIFINIKSDTFYKLNIKNYTEAVELVKECRKYFGNYLQNAKIQMIAPEITRSIDYNELNYTHKDFNYNSCNDSFIEIDLCFNQFDFISEILDKFKIFNNNLKNNLQYQLL